MDLTNINFVKFNSSYGSYMKWDKIYDEERMHEIVDYLSKVHYEPLEKILSEIDFVGGGRKQHNAIVDLLREQYKDKIQKEKELMERAKVDFGYNFDYRDKDIYISSFPETEYDEISEDLKNKYTKEEYGLVMNLLRYFREEKKACNE